MAQPTSTLRVGAKARSRRSQGLTKPLIRGSQVTGILFLIPALAIFLIFVVWPILQSARYSVYSWDGIKSLEESVFVGFANYQRLLNDPVFWHALLNNIFVVVWSLVTQIPLGILLAILLTGKLKGSPAFRTLYFAPLVLSDVLVATIWGWFFNPTIGLANSLLHTLGLRGSGWLSDPSIALACIMFISTWKYLGFYIVIFIAAIQGIPEELYEVARIDGAGDFQLHRYITIPLLTRTSRTSAVLIIVGSLKFFDLVWALTQGGPSHGTEVIATYMFKQAFQSKDWSYGSALAFTLFFIAFITAIIFLLLSRPRRDATV